MPFITTSLGACIAESLKRGEMVRELPAALLSDDCSKLLHRDETEYWDYKLELHLDDPIAVARLAKDILGFFNARGGLLVVGVSNNHRIPGIPAAHVKDTNFLRGKLHKYIGNDVHIFQDSVPLANGRLLWLIFVSGHTAQPQPALSTYPEQGPKTEIRRDEFYLRRGDQVITCKGADLNEVFRGAPMHHLHAYAYDVDEPYYRLFSPDFAEFVGRSDLLAQIYEALKSRHPVVSLDGVGGVGKTATAIKILRQLYDEGHHLFLISLSAKSRVWEGHVGSRRPAFSGLTEFLRETARVLQIPPLLPPDELKGKVLDAIAGSPGVFLVDNLEDVQDPELMKFLSFDLPDPVKVLVTSRINRGVGGVTISIPAMTSDEARQLLTTELSRARYPWIGETQRIDELVRITQCLPLAVKWTASLAVSAGSLRTACERLRRDDVARKEFLGFCFYTMFDALSLSARDVAMFSVYLDREWSVETVALGLGIPTSDVDAALAELEDRGVVLASSAASDEIFRVLPLTFDFLMAKWHENEPLQKRVATNLAAAVNSKDYEGIFMHWPVEQRVAALRERAENLLRDRHYEAASDLISLATRWAPADLGLRFLAGRISFESGRRSEGMGLMGRAVGPASKPEEHEYLANALITYGTGANQPLALKELETVLLRSTSPSRELVSQYVDLALRLKDYESLARVLTALKTPVASYWIATSLPRVFDDAKMLSWCGPSLVRVFSAAADQTPDAGERSTFTTTARKVESDLARLGLA